MLAPPTAVAPTKEARSSRSRPITALAEVGPGAEGGRILAEDPIRAVHPLVKHTPAPTTFLPRCYLTTPVEQTMRRLMTRLLGLLQQLQAARVAAAGPPGSPSLSTVAQSLRSAGSRGVGSSLPGRSLRSLPAHGERRPSHISRHHPLTNSRLQTSIRRALVATPLLLNHIRIRNRSSSLRHSNSSSRLPLLPIKVSIVFPFVFLAFCRLFVLTHCNAVSGEQR